MNDLLQTFQRDGCALLPGVFAPEQVAQMQSELASALEGSEAGGALRGRGAVYAARNVLTLYPSARTLWKTPPLLDLLQSALGSEYGLVRGLFFDKPPGRTWSLPWHRDRTIAVADNRLPSAQFCKPTTKAGVPHLEAPRVLLERMLTLRIHLDDVTQENGPLHVIIGSHAIEDDERAIEHSPRRVILAAGGDVLAMRPLLIHSSVTSQNGATLRRRILHLEFAGQSALPDGFLWHEFVR